MYFSQIDFLEKYIDCRTRLTILDFSYWKSWLFPHIVRFRNRWGLKMGGKESAVIFGVRLTVNGGLGQWERRLLAGVVRYYSTVIRGYGFQKRWWDVNDWAYDNMVMLLEDGSCLMFSEKMVVISDNGVLKFNFNYFIVFNFKNREF